MKTVMMMFLLSTTGIMASQSMAQGLYVRPQMIYQEDVQFSDEPLLGGGMSGAFILPNGLGLSIGANLLPTDAVEGYVIYTGDVVFEYLNKGNFGSYALAGVVVNTYNLPDALGENVPYAKVGYNAGIGLRYNLSKLIGVFGEAKYQKIEYDTGWQDSFVGNFGFYVRFFPGD